MKKPMLYCECCRSELEDSHILVDKLLGYVFHLSHEKDSVYRSELDQFYRKNRIKLPLENIKDITITTSSEKIDKEDTNSLFNIIINTLNLEEDFRQIHCLPSGKVCDRLERPENNYIPLFGLYKDPVLALYSTGHIYFNNKITRRLILFRDLPSGKKLDSLPHNINL